MSKKIIVPLANMRYALHDLFHEYLDEMYETERLLASRNNGRRIRFGHYDWMDDDEVRWAMQNGYTFPGMDDDDIANYYDYDDDDDEDPDLVWPPSNRHEMNDDDAYARFWEEEERKAKKGKKKHSKSRGKGKNKRDKNGCRIIDITVPYSGDEEDPTEYGTYEDLESDGIEDGKQIYYYPDYHDKSSRLEFTTLKAFDEFCGDNGFVVPPYIGEKIAYRRISHACLLPSAREEGIYEIMAEESYGDMVYEACDVSELSQ